MPQIEPEPRLEERPHHWIERLTLQIERALHDVRYVLLEIPLRFGGRSGLSLKLFFLFLTVFTGTAAGTRSLQQTVRVRHGLHRYSGKVFGAPLRLVFKGIVRLPQLQADARQKCRQHGTNGRNGWRSSALNTR
ncbi:hypothetical protein [Terriglobus roseus]|uniref:hypothetical protein n=1 Tax=Terriglobus roseus TaxID=392734 RepID=UPI001FCCCFEF|nr:hypothetical protein [Terriglobus roseus]